MSTYDSRKIGEYFDALDGTYARDIYSLDRDLIELGLLERTEKLLGTSPENGLHLDFFPKTGALIMRLRQKFSSLAIVGVDINPHLISALSHLFIQRGTAGHAIADTSFVLKGASIRHKYRSHITDDVLRSLDLPSKNTFLCDDPRELSLTQDLFRVKGVKCIDSATAMFPDSSARVAFQRKSDLKSLDDMEITKRVGEFLNSSRENVFKLVSRMTKPNGVFVYGEECLAPSSVEPLDVHKYLLNIYPDHHGYWEVGDCSMVTTQKQPKLKTVRISSFIQPQSGAEPTPFRRTLLFQQLIRTEKPFQG